MGYKDKSQKTRQLTLTIIFILWGAYGRANPDEVLALACKQGCIVTVSSKLEEEQYHVDSMLRVSYSLKAPCLCIAAFHGRAELVNFLIKEKKANVDLLSSTGESPLFFASLRGHKNVVEVLCDAGAQLNLITERFSTPLGVAVWEGHEGIVDVLIGAGSDPNHVFPDGKIALHYAVIHKKTEVTTRLLDAGSHINWTDQSGYSPLHYAITNGDGNMVSLLTARDCDTTGFNKKGETAYSMATRFKKPDILQMLLEKDDSLINRPHEFGATLLHFAVERHDAMSVQLLLANNKCQKRVFDTWGHTPHDLSIQLRYREIAPLVALENFPPCDQCVQAGAATRSINPLKRWKSGRYIINPPRRFSRHEPAQLIEKPTDSGMSHSNAATVLQTDFQAIKH